MAQNIQQVGYGLTQALLVQAPKPIEAKRAPTSADKGYPLGQLWVDKVAAEAYILVSIVNNAASWTQIESAGGSGSFTTLTSTGNTTLATGAGTTNSFGSSVGSTNTFGAASGTINTIGSTAGASSLTLSAGTGNMVISGAAATTIAIGTGITTGSISVGAALTTGTLDLGSATGLTTVGSVAVTAAGTTVINNVRVGQAIYTGNTTAAAASLSLTLTNSIITATSSIFMTVSNLGANDANMTLVGVRPGAGTATIVLINNGSQALNGNVQVSFWVVN